MIELAALTLALGLPTVVALPFVSRALATFERSFCKSLLIIAIAFGCGIGLTSIFAFIRVWMNNGLPRYFAIIESVVLLIILVLAIIWNRTRQKATGSLVEESFRPIDRAQSPAWQPYLTGAFIITTVLAIATMIVMSKAAPHGRWDAWCIWNLRARFLYLGGDNWQRVFDPAINWSHPDYPLLLPMTIARGWHYAGNASTTIAAGVSITFALAGTFAIAGVVGILRGQTMGLLAGMLVIGSKYFIRHGAYQYADTPLAFYFVLALGSLLLIAESKQHRISLWLLVGLMCGHAAWTKNEGLPFAIVCGVLVGVLALRHLEAAERLRPCSAFVLGALPGVLITLLMKALLAPPNDLMSSQDQFTQLTSIERYQKIAAFLMRSTLSFGEGVLLLTLTLAGLLCLGRRCARRTVAYGSAVVVAMAITYFLVFLLTPHDLDWHLTTAAKRLILQLFPCVVLVAMLLPHGNEGDQIDNSDALGVASS